jgi:DNA-directed RNA polymerase specialized sigma24 family protein
MSYQRIIDPTHSLPSINKGAPLSGFLDVSSQKNFRRKLRTEAALKGRREPLLHVVDGSGHELESDLQSAVHAAYLRVLSLFRRKVDDSVLADMAEDVAASIAIKRSSIRSIRSYSTAALIGKVKDWLRTQPRIDVSVGQLAELEDVGYAAEDPAFAEVEIQRLLEQLNKQLTERDRLILLLMIRGQGDPKHIGAALHLNYAAAAKAIQRTRSRVADILSGSGSGIDSNPLDQK